MQTLHLTTEAHFIQIDYIYSTQSHSIMSIPVVHSGKGTHPLCKSHVTEQRINVDVENASNPGVVLSF